MTICELITTLCQLDPKAPVLLSLDGFPPKDMVELERVYDNYNSDTKQNRVVLTINRDNYKKPTKKKKTKK